MQPHNDSAATAVLGTMLMMGLMMSLIPGVLLMVGEGRQLAEAQTDAARAERERAEFAAWCARNPQTENPNCPSQNLPPGHECKRLPDDAYLCTPNKPSAKVVQ
jgi:hypothetical protein